MKIYPIAACAIFAVTVATPAWCAPPLVTDDASTLVPGACQFEIEQRQFRNRVERDMVPVCNVWWDTEIGIGHQRVAADGMPNTNSIVYQFKKVLISTSAEDWSFAIAGATVRAAGGESGIRQNVVNTILSRQISNTTVHFNLGGVSDREAAAGTPKNKLVWAVAAEHEATDRWTLVGEAFGQRGAPASAQIGMRWWVVPKHVQLTTSLGAQRGEGRDGRWFSFGIRFETGDPVF